MSTKKILTPEQKAAKYAKRKARKQAKQSSAVCISAAVEISSVGNFQFVGSADTNPSDYQRVGHFIAFTVPVGEGEGDYDIEVDADLDADVAAEFGSAEHFYNAASEASPASRKDRSCKCNICNNDVKRMIYFRNIQTRTYIVSGLDCAHSMLKYNFNVEGARKQSLAARRKRDTLNKCVAVLEAHPGLEEALNVNDFKIREISKNFYRFGKLSDKQIAFINALASKRIAFEAASKPLTAGKIKDSEWTILSIKPKFAYDEFDRWSVLLQNADGGKLSYTGNSASLCNLIGYIVEANKAELSSRCGRRNHQQNMMILAATFIKGIKVEVSGTITVSKDDEFFGFLKTGKFYVIDGPSFLEIASANNAEAKAKMEESVNAQHNASIDAASAALRLDLANRLEAIKEIELELQKMQAESADPKAIESVQKYLASKQSIINQIEIAVTQIESTKK